VVALEEKVVMVKLRVASLQAEEVVQAATPAQVVQAELHQRLVAPKLDKLLLLAAVPVADQLVLLLVDLD
jgi:hypothetical protein